MVGRMGGPQKADKKRCKNFLLGSPQIKRVPIEQETIDRCSTPIMLEQSYVIVFMNSTFFVNVNLVEICALSPCERSE